MFLNRQSAYRANHSTETVLLEVSNSVLRAIDDGDSCALPFFDMSSAFDIVDHSLLIRMLEQICSLRGTALKRCSDYLTNRSQSVIVGESVSNSYPLCYGVPQGSNLDQVLFLIYTISVSNVVANHAGVDEHPYSDDFLLRVRFQPSTSPSTVITKKVPV